jgi:hypothetical protein
MLKFTFLSSIINKLIFLIKYTNNNIQYYINNMLYKHTNKKIQVIKVCTKNFNFFDEVEFEHDRGAQ